MRVVGVQLRDFRGYARAEARLGAGLTVVHGANGAGKSNLLEAIYYGCTGRSARTRNERELVRFGAQAARVAVRVHDGRDEHELSVAYAPAVAGEQAQKRMSFDGARLERMLDAPARPLVSVFEPDRLELVKGAPSLRRAHLDQLLAALWPARASARRDFDRVLAQRNALIARIRSGASRDSALATWDREFARAAIALMQLRASAVDLLADPFTERAAQLGCSGTVTLEYRPRSRATDEEDLATELRERLQRDLDRGYSAHGPQRDELALLRDGRELRTYGSQGEQRVALLALLLAERAVLASERATTPLMLLDDVMSELDAERRALLARELAAAGQSVIAATELAHVPGAGEPSVTRIRISAGSVLQEALAA